MRSQRERACSATECARPEAVLRCRYATLRTRLRCEVVGRGGEVVAVSHVMNECVIDTDAPTSLCTLDTVRPPPFQIIDLDA